MNVDAMKELLAAVEADVAIAWGFDGSHDALPDHWQDAMCAHLGDMNAAIALHGALLQGWVGQVDTAGYAVVWKDGEESSTTQDVLAPDKPARALLIATLKGKIAEMEGGTP